MFYLVTSLVYNTHQAVGETHSNFRCVKPLTLDETRQLEVNTTVAEDIPADDI
jgi:hypothetical protein